MAPRQRNDGGLHPGVSRLLSCGVVLTDGRRLLIGHATASARWDIPKGQAEPGEAADVAARRELEEETGVVVGEAALVPLGQHRYLASKDLALFAWLVESMPDPASLRCRSTFMLRGHAVPEFDRFDCPGWAEALPKLGKGMQTVLGAVAASQGWPTA